ncbi:DUF5329 domain-containing protein [Iodobacter ciconiae]|uniref:DUF5329 domain-containing protein n=1 Tax=Iodobacter ciconiae TaxID=2496266 RepID=A0A3S8ZW36_9NEIS|nr:DUF5329 domain-containing protein [Iodobacter ciconiae]AZN37713.1 hypothetical protein EJO50_15295 [Iodobacter ciconiae]
MYRIIFILLPLVSSPGFAIDGKGEQEVNALLQFIEKANCTFIRNGSNYSAKEGADHMRDKFNKTRDKLKSADDFIEHIASSSYFSGKPYQIQCGQAAAKATGPWLSSELSRIRKGGKP